MNMPFLLLSFFDDIRVARVCIRARGPYLVFFRPPPPSPSLPLVAVFSLLGPKPAKQ